MEQLNAAERKRFLNYWGDIFERYVQDLLTHYYTSQAPVNRTYPGDGQVDALLRVGDDLIVFEVKAGFLRDEAKGSRDPEIIDAAMRRKYVTDDAGKGVGVRQLAATAAALFAGKVPGVKATGRIYPILVGEDPILQTPAVNTYLNDIFREEITDDRVCPLTVMLVDELEQLLPNIAADDVTWQELLTRRFNGSRVVAEPIHTTLIDVAIERGFGRRADRFLRKQSEMLIEIIKNAYKDLK